jgi:hypothetical protein
VIALLAVGLILWVVPQLKEELLAEVSEKTGRSVSVASLEWAFWPALTFGGTELAVGAMDPESIPLVQVGSFSLELTLKGLLAKPRALETLQLRDLKVHIPPRTKEPGLPEATTQGKGVPTLALTIGTILAERARIEISSSNPGRPPRVFKIDRLALESFDLRRAVPYQAALRYQRPPGDLTVEGSFGPVDNSDPKQTPFSGLYLFSEADLGVFGGIAGRLTTEGTFSGTIEETEVAGNATVPDFHLTRVKNVVPLEVDYSAAILDNAATIELRQVNTAFGKSLLLTTGDVSRIPDQDGRRVSLKVSTTRARVEDLISFAVQSDSPPLSGLIDMQTDILIPPGPTPFIERLRAEGDFLIQNGRFSSTDIQKYLDQISRIGGGVAVAEEDKEVVAEIGGGFLLQDRRIRFSRLNFRIPGMKVELTGTYSLAGEILNFLGRALLDRTPSEMSGPLGSLIRIIDPLFGNAQAGTVIPIKIEGTRTQPKFSVDFSRLTR